jgi:hypothetical protein
VVEHKIVVRPDPHVSDFHVQYDAIHTGVCVLSAPFLQKKEVDETLERK